MEIIKKTSSDWSTYDQALANDQVGVETDTDRVKFGDGESLWSELDYKSYIEFFGEDTYVVPENYGTLSNDDTEIIQAALDSGKDVYFTNDTYNIVGTLYVRPNTRIYSNGSVLKVTPETGVNIKDVFCIGDEELSDTTSVVRNVILENLTFELNETTSSGSDDTSVVPTGGKRRFISIYDNAENVVVRNCTFNGGLCCIGMFETDAANCPVTSEAFVRKNITIKDIWATNVVECLVGETDVKSVYVDNIHIETVPTTTDKHAIRFNANVEDIKINNFFIKHDFPDESNSNGCPFSFYNPNSIEASCSQPIYLSNGEIHAVTLGESTAPYEIFAYNVNVINDIEFFALYGLIFNHIGESTGNYYNCTFDNCYQIRNGYFLDCTFNVAEELEYFINFTGAHNRNVKTERTFLSGCTINMNNTVDLVAVEEDYDSIEIGAHYYMDLKSCSIENHATYEESGGKIIRIYNNTTSNYDINISDCDFDEWFCTDFYKGTNTIVRNFIVDIKRSSFKESFTKSNETTAKLTKRFVLCNKGSTIID